VQALLDKQDQGEALSDDERLEAEGLVDLAPRSVDGPTTLSNLALGVARPAWRADATSRSAGPSTYLEMNVR